MNWMELTGYFINLDNVAFVTQTEDPTKTSIGFIGGQSMSIDMSYENTKLNIRNHHESRGIK